MTDKNMWRIYMIVSALAMSLLASDGGLVYWLWFAIAVISYYKGCQLDEDFSRFFKWIKNKFKQR